MPPLAAKDPIRFPGALVISLDFELFWGGHDYLPPDGGAYRQNLLGARAAVPEMLRLFEHYDVAATWATVGILFAKDREEFRQYLPSTRPRYRDSRLDPYRHPIGNDEADDSLRFAPSLVDAIRETKRQEIASHTFSHFYCLEPGQDHAAFRADLESAVKIATAKGIKLRSIVFPKNQLNPSYSDIVKDCGFTSYRGNQVGWMFNAGTSNQANSSVRRAARLADAYLPLSRLTGTDWNTLREPSGLVNVPASAFLRPYAPKLQRGDWLRVSKLKHGIEKAAKDHRVFHLWWHPHNFGRNTAQNLDILQELLDHFSRMRDSFGMESLSMGEVAESING